MDYAPNISSRGAASAAAPAPYDDVSATPEPSSCDAAQPNKPAPTISFDLPKGTWFDETITLRDPEGDAFTKRALDLIAKSEARKRNRRPVDEANLYTIVRSLLANGVRCYHFRKPSRVAYLRKADGYSDKPVWLSGKAMSRAIDALSKAGLVTATIGEQGSASTYDLTNWALLLAKVCHVDGRSIAQNLLPEGLVRLRSSPPERIQLPFASSDYTQRSYALLEAYNAFLRQRVIDLNISPKDETEWIRHLNADPDKSGMPVRRPERFRTALYRQFNNGSFDEGGRLYGGWWINVPKVLRPQITIDGQPTVELDFAGCAIRMLYHEKGIDCLDDPYHLDAIASYEEELGLRSGHFREDIKRMTQALINGEGSNPERSRLLDGFSLRPRFNRPQIRQMIEEKHTAIAECFGTGAGLRLQRRDSDLALEIISNLQDEQIAALPIHDSFIVPIEAEQKLRDEMTRSYNESFGFCPVIN